MDGVTHAITHADRNRLEPGQDVELGEDEVRDAVDARGVSRDDRVVPAASTRPAGRRPELGSAVAQPLTLAVFELGRERTGADAGGVGLDDRDDAIDAG